ncbi:TlpA family protein disulfide reductase [Chryseobacterium sp. MEBOG06]|uniref:TlpA family protein disulfide reductase n=1 Tax=unclassified Chryseobacterium TaxID=2593645 RepID=UPI001F1A0750|nr:MULTISPECIES: TlpA disulfide reductase family protein [unclassified Chryseobacterium]UKB85691.1 TlpA family protein disulfide reductase [Chryseobacterium sp. MEBOG06]
MERLKKWLRSNWSTAILMILFIILLVNKDAKAWLMRQVASTGILNSHISEPKEDHSGSGYTSYAGFILKNEDGTVTDVSDLKNKVVFINFWASWCPPCRAEFPSVQKLYEKYKSNPDIVFLTVNMDDKTELGKTYLLEKGFSVPFLVPASSIPDVLYNGSLPTTVVLDKKGEIRLHHTGVADYSTDSFYEQIDELLKQKL